ncbi:ArnT family glycosyltransferase [Elusimicrobiota bacterium]
MVRARDWIVLAAVLAAGLPLSLYGLTARLPGAERTRLVATEGEIRDLSEALVRSREEVYRTYKTPDTIYDDYFERDRGEEVEVRLGGVAKRVKKTKLDSIRSYLLQPEYTDDALILRALSNISPGSLKLDPHYYQYGGLYLYTIGAAIRLGGALGAFDLTRDIGRYFLNPDDLGRLYAAPRVVGAAGSAAAALVLFMICFRFFGPARLGWLTAFFFLICPVVVVFNHQLKPHTFFLPFSLLSIYFSLLALKDGRMSRYVLSGVLAGMAAGAVLFGGFAFCSLLAAHGLREWERRAYRAFWDRRILFACAAFCAALFLVSPFQILSLPSVLADARHQAGGDMSVGVFLANLFGLYFMRFPLALGWGLWLLCTAGLVHSLVHRDRRTFVLLATAVPLYVFVCAIKSPERYAMLAYPLLILLAMRAADSVLSSGNRVRAVVAALVLCALYTFGYSAFYDAVLVSGDPKLRAGRWINGNLPAGASVATAERLVFGYRGYPPLRLLDYEPVRWGPGLKKKPDYYLAVGYGDRPGNEAPDWGESYRREMMFERDFGWADRVFRNHFLMHYDLPITVYGLRPGQS